MLGLSWPRVGHRGRGQAGFAGHVRTRGRVAQFHQSWTPAGDLIIDDLETLVSENVVNMTFSLT